MNAVGALKSTNKEHVGNDRVSLQAVGEGNSFTHGL